MRTLTRAGVRTLLSILVAVPLGCFDNSPNRPTYGIIRPDPLCFYTFTGWPPDIPRHIAKDICRTSSEVGEVFMDSEGNCWNGPSCQRITDWGTYFPPEAWCLEIRERGEPVDPCEE